jgi:hypothetical protein
MIRSTTKKGVADVVAIREYESGKIRGSEGQTQVRVTSGSMREQWKRVAERGWDVERRWQMD